MSRWRLNAELWLASLGRGPLWLLATGLVAGVLWGVLLPAASQRTSEETARLETLRRQAAAARTMGTIAPPPSADALATFHAGLADSGDIARLQQQLWQQGAAAGLQMSRVDYRSEPDTGGGFERLSVTLPMTGPYPAVRKFVFNLMAAFPSLSLDQLDIKRDAASSASVETTVRLTLLTRP